MNIYYWDTRVGLESLTSMVGETFQSGQLLPLAQFAAMIYNFSRFCSTKNRVMLISEHNSENLPGWYFITPSKKKKKNWNIAQWIKIILYVHDKFYGGDLKFQYTSIFIVMHINFYFSDNTKSFLNAMRKYS